MGHYCKICGRIRANEKFSGKGHKNHICKDCSRKSSKSAKNTFLTVQQLPFNSLKKWVEKMEVCN